MLFEALTPHIHEYDALRISITQNPGICFLNLLLPKVKMFKIESIEVLFENLKMYNFKEEINLKNLELYVKAPTNLYQLQKVINCLSF